MTKIQENAVKDNVKDAKANQLVSTLDTIFKQVGTDLEKQVKGKMAEMEKSFSK